MSNDHITREVRLFVAEKLGDGDIISVRWLANEMMQRRASVRGKDSDFYIACTFEHLIRLIKKVIGKYEPSDIHDEQLTFRGFERLQTGYPVERNGERVLVPTPKCTDDELLARATQHDGMSRGHAEHAEELRSYVRDRRAAA